jgi:hypothetical protein
MAKAKEPKVTKRKRQDVQLVGYLRISSLDQMRITPPGVVLGEHGIRH